MLTLIVIAVIIIAALNFVLFGHEQLYLIGNGYGRIVWYNIFMMGTSCFVMLFPLIYMWAKIRKERKAKL